jgi:hypothetical protein
MMLPLLVLPLSRLTTPAVGIARRMVLAIPAVGITTRLLKLSPLPLERSGIAPWCLRGEGPTIRLTRGRLIRPGQGVWRA